MQPSVVCGVLHGHLVQPLQLAGVQPQPVAGRAAVDGQISSSLAYADSSSEWQIEELKTIGYTSLLRIERGRLRHRDIFGPVRLHYGLFQIHARHSHYLIAKNGEQIAGAVCPFSNEA